MGYFTDKFVRRPVISRLTILFCALQVALLVGIITLWVLSVVTDNDVIYLWGLWRLVDLATLIWALTSLVWVNQVESSSAPGIVTFIVGGLVVCADLASLIWFGIIYQDCRQFIKDGIPTTEPLCLIANMDKVSLWYLVLTSVITLNNLLYTILVGILFILVTMKSYRTDLYAEKFKAFAALRRTGQALKYAGYAMYGLNFFTFGWLFIVIEVMVLSTPSNSFFLFVAHLPHFLCIVQTFLALESKKWNRRFTWISVFVVFASGIAGLLPSVLYLTWLCDPLPIRDWGTITTCEYGAASARYFVALHAMATLIAIIRIGVYAFILMFQEDVTVENSANIPNVTSTSAAKVDSAHADLSKYGLTRRLVTANGKMDEYVPLTSALTGDTIYV